MIEDSRIYHRFPLASPRLCLLSDNGITIGPISEISYGGFAIVLNDEQLNKWKKISKKKPTEHGQFFQLTFLNKTVFCYADERYQWENKIGFQLSHEQTEVLCFLKEIIPWIRAGAALGCLNRLESEGLTKELPEYLAFDGPIPVEIDWTGLDSNKIPNFNITFKQDKVLYRLVKNNKTLTTEHNVWPGAESGALRPTHLLDDMICRNGLSILSGLASESDSALLVQTIEQTLDIYQNIKGQALYVEGQKAS